MNKMPETPEKDPKRERFLKKRGLGCYRPGYEPLIPWGYIESLKKKK